MAAPIAVQTLEADAVIDRAASLASRTLASLRGAGFHVVAMKVAATGVIDYRSGTVRFAPNLGWRNVPLIAELAARVGCWETIVGLTALFGLVDPDGTELSDPTLPLEDRLQIVRARAEEGDRRTLDALAMITANLATGVSILVDILIRRSSCSRVLRVLRQPAACPAGCRPRGPSHG